MGLEVGDPRCPRVWRGQYLVMLLCSWCCWNVKGKCLVPSVVREESGGAKLRKARLPGLSLYHLGVARRFQLSCNVATERKIN